MAFTFMADALRAMREHVRASDLVLAGAVLFAFSAAVSRLAASRRGAPMLWPVVGIVSTLFVHLDDIYDWGADRRLVPVPGHVGGGSSGVITSVPANVEHVLKGNFGNYPKGPYYRERLVELLGEGIFNAETELWRAQRRAVTAEMHSSQFVEFSSRNIEQLVYGLLVPLVDRLLDGGEAAVDLQEVLLQFTFDNVCAVAFGADAGCLADGLPDVPFARAFELATELSLLQFVTPPFIWKTKRLLCAGSEQRPVEATRAVREFTERTVADSCNEMRKVGSMHGRCDLLSRLMSAPGSDYSDEFLRDFCISFILAGRDTSSVALAWFFWLLVGHPDVESRVVDDVLAADGDIKKMDYIHAALTEAMHLYPPVPVDFKEALADDVLPDATLVRARQRVIYYTYAMGRDPASWGEDEKTFRPEWWMRGGAFAGGESPFKYVVFNAGPRLCIGKRLAYTQMKTVAAAVLSRFAVEVVPGQEVKPKLNTTLYMKNGLMVRFRRREQPPPQPQNHVVVDTTTTSQPVTLVSESCNNSNHL